MLILVRRPLRAGAPATLATNASAKNANKWTIHSFVRVVTKQKLKERMELISIYNNVVVQKNCLSSESFDEVASYYLFNKFQNRFMAINFETNLLNDNEGV